MDTTSSLDYTLMSLESISIDSEETNELYYNKIENKCFLLGIENREHARTYIDYMLSSMTIWEIFRIYNGINNEELNYGKKEYDRFIRKTDHKLYNQTGTSREATDIHPKIVDFIAMLDTVHDFKYNKDATGNGKKKQELLKDFTITLDKYITDNIHKIPINIDRELLYNETRLISELNNLEILNFIDSTSIANPFKNFNIKNYDVLGTIAKNINRITYEDLLVKQQNSTTINSTIHKKNYLSVDMWFMLSSPTNISKKTYKLEHTQVIHLCRYINQWFSGYAIDNILTFLVDGTSDQQVRLLFALSLLNHELEDYFSNSNEIQTYLTPYNQNIQSVTKWHVPYTSANLFDGQGYENIKDIDVREIGDIYPPSFKTQIHIDKLVTTPPEGLNKQQLEQFQPYASVTIVDASINSTLLTSFNLKYSDANDIFSSKRIIETYLHYPITITKANKKMVATNVLSYPLETQFAIKRAGDWGQVINCYRYNKVFVTCDRYAAMYAYYLKVPCILIKQTLEIKKEKVSINADLYPDFAQFSFILLLPDI